MNQNLTYFKSIVNKLLIITSIINVIFFFSWANVFVISILLFGWYISYNHIYNDYNLKYYPLSTFVLIGYTFFFVIMPIPATLLEFKPVIFNLKNPIETFIHITLMLLVLVMTHFCYKRISGRKNIIRLFLKKTVFYTDISSKEIWILSVFALGVIVINILIYGRFEENDNKPILLQISSYFRMFVGLPILFLYPSYKLIKNSNKTKHYLIILFIAIILFVVGISSNFRTEALSFIVLIATSFLFAYLTNQIKIKIKAKYMFLLILSVWFFSGPFLDISLSMVIVRGERVGINGIELFEKTIDTYNDKNKLRVYKKALNYDKSLIGDNDWDETYLDNDILARFCSVKTIDETIYYAKQIGYANPDMQLEYGRQILAIFPPAITNVFGITSDERSEISRYSMTDFLYAKAMNDPSGMGSAKIGSFPGIGLSIFGYGYLIMIIPIFYILFVFFDSTLLVKSGQFKLSIWAFLNLFLIFYITSAGHNFQTDVKYIIRGFLESIFFYTLGVFLVKQIVKLKI